VDYVVALRAFLGLPRQLLHIELPRRQQDTPPRYPPQERHGGYPPGPGHAGDGEPEAAEGDGPDGRPGGLHRPAGQAEELRGACEHVREGLPGAGCEAWDPLPKYSKYAMPPLPYVRLSNLAETARRSAYLVAAGL